MAGFRAMLLMVLCSVLLLLRPAVAQTPIFWADGLTDARQLDAYKECGLNTLVIRLTWQANQNEAVGTDEFAEERALAEAANARGLRVIFSVPAAPQGMERALRLSAQSRAYLELWQAWVAHAVQTLRPTPNLLGWMLPDDPRRLPFDDNAAFTHWMSANYASVEVLNRQWGAQFASLDDVSLESSDALIAAWKNAAARNENGTRDQTFHPATLALARFRREAYQELMRAWASFLRASDPDAPHLLCSGRLPDYAQLLALPPEIDVSVPDIRPGAAEKDLLSHNPQAVSIARRGGRFRAVPVLETQGSDAVSSEQITRLMPLWADAMLSRGASGLAFASWPALMRNSALLRGVQNTLNRLQTPPFSRLWNALPTSTSAIVLTPLADGHTLQIDPNAVSPPRGLYGFGQDMVSGEPSNLVWVLRWGTAFGSVDFLSSDDVEAMDESSTPLKPPVPDFLKRYNTLLLPQALSVSPAMARSLTRYVESGGVVMADLGAGAAQVGGDVSLLPPELQTLFGVSPFPGLGVRALNGNFGSLQAHPLLPTWEAASGRRAGATLTQGDGPGGVAFSGPSAFFEPLTRPNASDSARENSDTTPVAVAQRVVLPGDPMRGASDVVARTLLTVHDLGQGHALFAPVRLWNFWRPGLLGFDGLHGDLFARDALLTVAGATSLVPAPRGNTAYPEVVNFPTMIALLNHAAPSDAPAALITVLQTGGAISNANGDTRGQDGDFLWDNVLNVLPARSVETINGTRPSPLIPAHENTPASTGASTDKARPVSLYALSKPGLMVTRLLPLNAQNQSGGALVAQVNQHDAQGIKLTLWPNATQVSNLPADLFGGNFNIEANETGAQIRLQLWDDDQGFRIRANSRHMVTVTDLTLLPPPETPTKPNKRRSSSPSNPAPRIQTFPVVADAQGCLAFQVTGRSILVEIAPAV